MTPPINIDGDTVEAITMDGTSVSEVTVDGDTVFGAIPDSGIIDSFEDQNLTEYSGSTGDFSTVTEDTSESDKTAQDGTIYLRTDTNQNATIYSQKGEGLERYPVRGNTIKWDTNIDGDDISEFHFGLVDTSNFYRAVVDDNAQEIRIEKDEGGTNTTLNSTSAAIVENDWLQCTVDFDVDGTGDIVFTVDNGGSQLVSVTANNASIDGAGIGFRGEQGGSGFFARWDHVRIP